MDVGNAAVPWGARGNCKAVAPGLLETSQEVATSARFQGYTGANRPLATKES